mmetsp:Transcript_41929/g.84010  ORF Transcript_41929/g.84010 Transcript_41929/m.84010 type:complete len:221 (-) Transcript_41929:672-1334(-)
MDSSHVSLVSLCIHSHGFEFFNCKKNFTLGVNLSSLNKILKCSSNDDSVTIKCYENSEILSFKFENQTCDRVSEFQLRLIHSDSEQLGIPETSYIATVSLTSVEYRRICTDMSTLGDTISIGISKEELKFQIEGDIGKGDIIIRQQSKEKKGENEDIFEVREPIKMSFSLKYLMNFSKAAPLCEKVVFKMSNDVPLQVEFKITKIGYIRYYLAPKMNDSI